MPANYSSYEDFSYNTMNYADMLAQGMERVSVQDCTDLSNANLGVWLGAGTHKFA